jgi:hypothetical protein
MYSVVSFAKSERNSEPQTITRGLETASQQQTQQTQYFDPSKIDNIKMAKIGIQEYNIKKKQNKIEEEEKKELLIMNKKEAILKLIVKTRNDNDDSKREERIKELKKIIVLYFQ